jgi:glycosyltransferase involved in cell wall biosynthesis
VKKVLMVGPVPPPFGGIAAVVEDIISSELNRDYQFKVFNKSEIPVSGFIKRVLFRLERLWAFMKEIRMFRPDFMHIHSADPAFMGTMIFVIIAKLFGLKVLAHLHGTDWDDFYTNQSSIKRKGIKFGLCIPDKVVVLYKKWAEKIREIDRVIDVHIIRNLIHLPKKEDPEVLIQIRESLDILNKKAILTIGSVGFRKGSFDIIKTVPIVLKHTADVVFVIVGGGENPGEFEKACSMVQDENILKNCKLVGEVERRQVTPILANCRCLFIAIIY